MNSFLCSLLKKGVSSWLVLDDPPKVQGIYYVASCAAFYSVVYIVFLFAMELCLHTSRLWAAEKMV